MIEPLEEVVFDLLAVRDIITKYCFKKVTLQFTDDYLDRSVDVFSTLVQSMPADNVVDFFIAADSTFGSSVDDVSAMHVHSDVIFYFGSDLSSSGSIPVVIVPPIKVFNIDQCFDRVTSEVSAAESIILLYDTGYYRACNVLAGRLQQASSTISVHLGRLPSSADLESWRPELKYHHHLKPQAKLNCNVSGSECCSRDSSNSHQEYSTAPNIDMTLDLSEQEQVQEQYDSINVGGLVIKSHWLNVTTPDSLAVLYVGNNQGQLTNILLRLSSQRILAYNPISDSLNTMVGSESREFRERYGGIDKVEHAEVIGIIIGSMGLTGELTQLIIHRLQSLIEAARKKSFVFVMGHINESKLGNFPEVDLYCLVANNDVALIKPKTFQVPVITPWELELALGAREWDSTYRLDLESFVGNNDDLRGAIERVQEKFRWMESSDDERSSADEDSSALIAVNAENRLMKVENNPIVERFHSREFTGLEPSVPRDLGPEIHEGMFGIARGYKHLSAATDC